MWGSALRAQKPVERKARASLVRSKTKQKTKQFVENPIPADGIRGESLQLVNRLAQSDTTCDSSAERSGSNKSPNLRATKVSCRKVFPHLKDERKPRGGKPGAVVGVHVQESQGSVECRLRSLLAKHGYLVRFSSVIGKGEYAVIRSAIRTKVSPKTQCAVKIINRDAVPRRYAEKFIPREVSMVKVLKHPQIVGVHDIIEIGQYIFIFMEDAKLGDLQSVLQKRGSFSPQQTKYIMTALLRALQYCHSHGIAHRNLTCENVLCFPGKYLSVKISDFSYARYCRDPSTYQKKLSVTYYGTPGNTAPEILRQTPYNPQMVDVWNLGAIAYTLLTGELPFSYVDLAKIHPDNHKVKDWSMKKLHENLEEYGWECADLVTSMLNIDVVCRPTLGMVAKHPWLVNLSIPRSLSHKIKSEGDLPDWRRAGKSKSTVQKKTSAL